MTDNAQTNKEHLPKTLPRGIFNMPAGLPFTDTLARGLLGLYGDNPETFAQLHILLPTRRACRTLQNSFLKLTEGKPLILPRLSTIADIDEDLLSLEISGLSGSEALSADILALPPAMPATLRRLMLARTILAAREEGDPRMPFDKAIGLATSLITLLDEIQTEDLDIKDLPNLVEAEHLAEHWNITVKFLEIISTLWPDILKENGYIDPAERRSKLINLLADYWQDNPPAYPVIAAGSTGSIPAAARLISIIADLPQGSVIMPGLDTQTLDADNLATIEPSHPQWALKSLCENLELAPGTVKDWPLTPCHTDLMRPLDHSIIKTRRFIAAEMMRPAQTTDQWRNILPSKPEAANALKDKIARAMEDIRLYECDNTQEEARLIGLIIREALELKQDAQPQTIAIVTPDRHLARRVTMACLRWDLHVDDSAGTSLPKTPIGALAMLIPQTLTSGFAASDLAALLKHRLCKLGMAAHERLSCISALELSMLRGVSKARNLDDYAAHLDTITNNFDNVEYRNNNRLHLPLDDYQKARELIAIIDDMTHDLQKLARGRHAIADFIKAHIKAIERIGAAPVQPATEDTPQPDDKYQDNQYKIWQGDDGEAMAGFFNDLYEHCGVMGDITLGDYISLIDGLMRGVTIRARYGMHPRVTILGQLEARLAQSDIIIMAGLNEGTWPPESAADPWMSRPMREKFGLPAPEYAAGLAAHDFVQGFCQKNVYLTRSKRDNGAPTKPVRWLSRLNTVLHACGYDLKKNINDVRLGFARTLDKTSLPPAPIDRPAPTPPADKRPDRLSVTQIEKWLQDPYHIYARHILRLYKLDEINEQAGNKDLGNYIHAIMEDFIKAYPAALPPRHKASEKFMEIAQNILSASIDDARLWAFWWPRIEKLSDWVITHETQWRERARPLLSEVTGRTHITYSPQDNNAGSGEKSFMLTARVDRIDQFDSAYANDKSTTPLAIIDYKTGGDISKKRVENGLAPQLPLTALILEDGGFENTPKSPQTQYLGYWYLKGSSLIGQEKELDIDIRATIDTTRSGLTDLIAAFDNDSTPYYSLPRPAIAPQYQDYAHLARVKEWSAFDDNANEGGNT